MFHIKKGISTLFITALIIGFSSSCSKESEVTPSVNISDATKTVDESVGTVALTIDLGETATQDVTINYVISGTAILNGDFEVTSGASVTIPKGSSTGTFNLTVFDDQVIEPSETIIVNFSSETLTFTNAKSEITITDNETDISADGLETDLTWDAGTLVNLDLYTANNVVIGSDNSIESFDLVQTSANEKGFESIFMKNSASDDEYYIVVHYNTGARNVNFKLTYNGPSISDLETDGTLSTSDVGYAIFYGPITKSGSTYNRQIYGSFNVQKAAPHVFKGKLPVSI